MNLTVIGLIKQLQEYQNHIGGDETRTGSHNLPSYVNFEIEDENFDLEEIELNYRIGCRCPEGITFRLKRRTNE